MGELVSEMKHHRGWGDKFGVYFPGGLRPPGPPRDFSRFAPRSPGHFSRPQHPRRPSPAISDHFPTREKKLSKVTLKWSETNF